MSVPQYLIDLADRIETKQDVIDAIIEAYEQGFSDGDEQGWAVAYDDGLLNEIDEDAYNKIASLVGSIHSEEE